MRVLDLIGLFVSSILFVVFSVIFVIGLLKGYEDVEYMFFPISICAAGAYGALSLIRKSPVNSKDGVKDLN